MSNVSQSPQEDSTEEFLPKSFIIFCLDTEDNVVFEASWGEEIEDIKKFSVLLHKIKSGDFDKMILYILHIYMVVLQYVIFREFLKAHYFYFRNSIISGVLQHSFD